MKNCSKCNLNFEDNIKFCGNCGSPLSIVNKIVSRTEAKIIVFEEKLKENQLNVDLLSEYAEFLYENSKYNEAISILFRILVISNKNQYANDFLFKIYQELKQYKNAIEIGEELLIQNPQNIVLIEDLIKLAIEIKDINKEFEFYNKILLVDPNNINALSKNAKILIDNNRICEATKIYSKLDSLGSLDYMVCIYSGIVKTLSGDYQNAIKNFESGLKSATLTNRDISIVRGKLFLAYCLYKTNSKLIEIERIFNSINFKTLKDTPFDNDEDIVIEIMSHILFKNLEKIGNTKNTNVEINYLIESIIDAVKPILSEKSNAIIADSYHNVAIKQKELGLNDGALDLIKKALFLNPKEIKYSDFKDEIQIIVDSKNAKHERNNETIIVIIGLIVIIGIISIRYILKYNQDEAWKYAKTTNSSNSYESYLKSYPDGKYKITADSLREEAMWLESVNSNSVEEFDKYTTTFPNGKYLTKSKKNVEELIWKKILSEQSSDLMETYLQRFPEGKYKTKVIGLIDDCNWNSIKNSNVKSAHENYLRKSPNGKYRQEASNKIEKINYTELHKNDWAIGWWESGARFIRIEDSKSCIYGSYSTMYYGTYTIEGSVLNFKAEKFIKKEYIKGQSTFNGGGISFNYNDPLKSYEKSDETPSDYTADFTIDFKNQSFELDGYVYKRSK